MPWEDVLKTAEKFEPMLREDWPDYYQEINGTLIVRSLPVK